MMPGQLAFDGQVAFLVVARNLAAVLVEQHGLHARQRQARAGRHEGVMPAMAEIMMPPVSVCHHVSTMGQRPLPTC